MDLKTGWKTSEFWLTMIAITLGSILASGLVTVGGFWEKLIGIAGAILSALGYTVSRGMAKSGSAKGPTIPPTICLIVGLGALLMLWGCASITTSLSGLQTATKGASSIAEPIINSQCDDAAKMCNAKQDKACKELVTCQDKKHKFNVVAKSIHLTIASGLSFYAAGDTKKASEKVKEATQGLLLLNKLIDEIIGANK